MISFVEQCEITHEKFITIVVADSSLSLPTKDVRIGLNFFFFFFYQNLNECFLLKMHQASGKTRELLSVWIIKLILLVKFVVIPKSEQGPELVKSQFY